MLVAGAWTGFLLFYRVLDRPPGNGCPVGIEWGFFLAFVAAGLLAYAGARLRAAHRPEPPLPRPPAPRTGEDELPTRAVRRPPEGQMSFEDR